MEDGHLDLFTETGLLLPADKGAIRHPKMGNLQGTWSSDGKWIALAGSNLVTVWDLETGELTVTPLRHSGIIHTIAFRGDSRVLATGCHDGFLRLWDISRGELMGSPIYMGNEMNTIRFSENGRYLTAGNDIDQKGRFLVFGQFKLPEKAWKEIAQLNSGFEANETGGNLYLRPSKLSSLFKHSNQEYPELFQWPIEGDL